MAAYRGEVLPWWQLNEYAYDTFMIRTRGRAEAASFLPCPRRMGHEQRSRARSTSGSRPVGVEVSSSTPAQQSM